MGLAATVYKTVQNLRSGLGRTRVDGVPSIFTLSKNSHRRIRCWWGLLKAVRNRGSNGDPGAASEVVG